MLRSRRSFHGAARPTADGVAHLPETGGGCTVLLRIRSATCERQSGERWPSLQGPHAGRQATQGGARGGLRLFYLDGLESGCTSRVCACAPRTGWRGHLPHTLQLPIPLGIRKYGPKRRHERESVQWAQSHTRPCPVASQGEEASRLESPRCRPPPPHARPPPGSRQIPEMACESRTLHSTPHVPPGQLGVEARAPAQPTECLPEVGTCLHALNP